MTTEAGTTDAVQGSGPVAVDAAVVGAFRDRLLNGSCVMSDAERVDLLGALEELKSAAAAVQVRVTAVFDASQRAQQAAAGVPGRDQGKGIAAQVGLARRESVSRGSRHLGLARILTGHLPRTLEALAAGKLSEWRTTLLVRETASTSPEHWRRRSTPGWGSRSTGSPDSGTTTWWLRPASSPTALIPIRWCAGPERRPPTAG